MTDERFIGRFQGDMLVSIRDVENNQNVNILQIMEIANKLADENEQLKEDINKRIVDYNGLNIEYEWLKEENEHLKQYKQSVNDVLLHWSQKNLTAKQLQVVIAIMEELNIKVMM